MVPELTPIERCAEIAGLRAHEIVLGVSPAEKHERMLASYRRAVSSDVARAKIVADLRTAVELGATRRAADLLVVLRRHLAQGPAQRDLERGREPGAAPRRRMAPARERTRVASIARGFERRSAPAGVGKMETDNVLFFDGFRRPSRG